MQLLAQGLQLKRVLAWRLSAAGLQVAGESEVKAQIKLRIRTNAGVPVVIIRSFVVRPTFHTACCLQGIVGLSVGLKWPGTLCVRRAYVVQRQCNAAQAQRAGPRQGVHNAGSSCRPVRRQLGPAAYAPSCRAQRCTHRGADAQPWVPLTRPCAAADPEEVRAAVQGGGPDAADAHPGRRQAGAELPVRRHRPPHPQPDGRLQGAPLAAAGACGAWAPCHQRGACLKHWNDGCSPSESSGHSALARRPSWRTSSLCTRRSPTGPWPTVPR